MLLKARMTGAVHVVTSLPYTRVWWYALSTTLWDTLTHLLPDIAASVQLASAHI